MRQAHRVALRAGGVRVEPGWIVGGLLAAALLSTRMVTGSTGVAAAPTVRSIESSLVRSSAAASSLQAASADLPRAASVETSGLVPHSASPVLGRMVTTSEIGAVTAPSAASPPRPKATPGAKAAHTTAASPPRPKATPGAKATPGSKASHATAAPKPKAKPKPKAAIAYRQRATGRATWGHFGGAVVTRLPPGTRIRVCGRLGCWEGASSGYGPSADGGNLVDLDAAVFRRLCGSLGTGVGTIVLSWR